MPATFTIADLEQATDVDLGVSEWHEVTQEQINRFADATDDHQWIHVDRERAAAGPFGTTIAHGYLTLSLLPALVGSLYEVSDRTMGINYGADRVRLTAPVPSGSRIRARARILDAQRKGGGVLIRTEATVEIDGSDKPALVATVLSLVFGGS